jgi:hypothetical protein
MSSYTVFECDFCPKKEKENILVCPQGWHFGTIEMHNSNDEKILKKKFIMCNKCSSDKKVTSGHKITWNLRKIINDVLGAI